MREGFEIVWSVLESPIPRFRFRFRFGSVVFAVEGKPRALDEGFCLFWLRASSAV
jgi:hypothetical protein